MSPYLVIYVEEVTNGMYSSLSMVSFAALLLLLSSPSHTHPDPRISHQPAQFFPQHGSQRVKITYGPLTVPSMHEDNGMKSFFERSTPLPCTDCLVTFMQADLEYDDGTPATASNGMWLHHTVFTNLNRPFPVCPQATKRGDNFFASGNERTPVNLCANGTVKAGYHVASDDEIAMSAELMNMSPSPRTAILTMTFEFVPGIPRGFAKIISYWLDAGGCSGDSSLPAIPNAAFDYSSPPFTVPEGSHSGGRVVFAGAHLHDGGTHARITRNGAVVCDSRAGYGGDEGQEHVVSLSACMDVGPTKPGDEWSVTAYYDTAVHAPMENMDGSLEPVMGIALVYVAESHHHHHRHHRALKIAAAVGLLLLLTLLGVRIWARMTGVTFSDVADVLRRRKRVRLVDGDTKFGRLSLVDEYHDDGDL